MRPIGLAVALALGPAVCVPLGVKSQQTGTVYRVFLVMVPRLIALAVAVSSAVSAASPVEARWNTNPTVTISAPEDDPRTASVFEAVEFWNRQLADIGSPLRLGPISHTTQELPGAYLRQLSATVLEGKPRPPAPEVVAATSGHIIVALSEGTFVSFTASLGSPGRVLIAIRSLMAPDLAQPNVARNLIAHEFGHALGLGHNSDATKLMCGRPAACRPQDYFSSSARFFPLTDEDKKILLRLYPQPVTETRQTGKVYRVGMLWQGVRGFGSGPFDLFLQSLAERSYVEGRNITFVHRWADFDTAREPLEALAKELLDLNVDVLFASSTPAIHALAKVTTTVPIVAMSVVDPVGEGLVRSLARPGGNVTGVSGRTRELDTKLLGLLKESRPRASRFAVIGSAASVSLSRDELEVAARSLGVQVQFLQVMRAQDIEVAFEMADKQRAEGLVMLPTLLLAANERWIAELALRHKLPTIFWRNWFAEAGGLMAYGPDNVDQWQRAGTLVAKILSGVKPADLPVEQADRFRLVINLKTAKALGLTIPRTLLLRADQVIE